MTVAVSDIVFYLTGAAEDGGAQADPAASLGKYRSSTVAIPATAIDDGDGISNADATITVDATAAFAASGYIWIETECIAYTGKGATTFTGCTRGSLSTDAAAHDDDAVIWQVSTLLDAISGTDSQAGDTNYGCLCAKNTNGADAANAVAIYLSAATGNAEDVISFAVEVPTGGDTDGYAQEIGTESDAPTVNAGNVSNWSTATTYGTAIGVDQGAHDANLDAGELVFIWLKRVVSAGADAVAVERVDPVVAFDTV